MLDKLNIDFNRGFILSLSIKEKQELKEKINAIDQKNNEQIDNQMRAK